MLRCGPGLACRGARERVRSARPRCLGERRRGGKFRLPGGALFLPPHPRTPSGSLAASGCAARSPRCYLVIYFFFWRLRQVSAVPSGVPKSTERPPSGGALRRAVVPGSACSFPVTLFSPERGPIKARALLNSKVVPVQPRNLVLGAKRGPGGGQVGSAAAAPSPRTSSRRGPSWFPPMERDLPNLALPQSLPGVWRKSACLLNKDEEDRSGRDLNFVTGALCPRTVALSVGLVRVAVQTCAGLCPSLTRSSARSRVFLLYWLVGFPEGLGFPWRRGAASHVLH